MMIFIVSSLALCCLAMRNKLITLDDESYEISKRMGNFSAFVRTATKATEEGGLTLVNPAEMPTMQCLAIVLNRSQVAGQTDRVNILLEMMNEIRLEEVKD